MSEENSSKNPDLTGDISSNESHETGTQFIEPAANPGLVSSEADAALEGSEIVPSSILEHVFETNPDFEPAVQVTPEALNVAEESEAVPGSEIPATENSQTWM